eukprot:1193806-Prorocentrum_minimum.AAC.6
MSLRVVIAVPRVSSEPTRSKSSTLSLSTCSSGSRTNTRKPLSPTVATTYGSDFPMRSAFRRPEADFNFTSKTPA